MLRYLTKRILLLIPVLFTVSTLVFSIIHLIPGDPVDLILGEQSLPADRQKMREALGLNRPLLQQYGHFLKGVAHGDLGQSLFERRPVKTMILERYPATLQLTVAAMFFAIVIALASGVTAAVKKGTVWDHASLLGGLVHTSSASAARTMSL
jgi:peptide/nickel transport system permease protein